MSNLSASFDMVIDEVSALPRNGDTVKIAADLLQLKSYALRCEAFANRKTVAIEEPGLPAPETVVEPEGSVDDTVDG